MCEKQLLQITLKGYWNDMLESSHEQNRSMLKTLQENFQKKTVILVVEMIEFIRKSNIVFL